MVEKITSLKDEKIQLAKSLNSLKGRIERGKFLLEGMEAINWAIDSDIELDFVLKSDKLLNFKSDKIDCRIYNISEGLLKKVTATKYVIPAVGIGNIKKKNIKSDFCLVLDNIQDFGNIGTIIRSCHAFGINNIMSTKSDFDLFQKKTVRASRGKVFNTNLRTFPNAKETIDYLKGNGFQIITTSPRGNQLQSLLKLDDKPIALVVGNETDGASQELMENADFTIQIPLNNTIESLNVGVATGISIYELKLKQVLGMIEKNIKSTLGREMGVASKLIRETLDTELKKVSTLTSTQTVFLMVLKCDQIMSLNDIQRQFGILNTDRDPFFNPLLKDKLITESTENKYQITEKGEETIGKLWTTIENTEKKILKDFTDSEKIELKKFIDKIKVNCEEIINEP